MRSQGGFLEQAVAASRIAELRPEDESAAHEIAESDRPVGRPGVHRVDVGLEAFGNARGGRSVQGLPRRALR